MKSIHAVPLFLTCLAVLVLAACTTETTTPTILETSATPQPHPAVVSPTAASVPTAYPAPATDTPAPAPTATSTTLPSPTETPRPTQADTPTPAPTPQVWEIWFEGFSCEGASSCDIGPGDTSSYFSIMSDGTGLRQLQIPALPTPPRLPQGAPPQGPGTAYPAPHVLPGGQRIVFGSLIKPGVYLADLEKMTVTQLFQPKADAGTWIGIGPACWAQEGTIRFLSILRRGNEPDQVTVDAINQQGKNLTELFSLPSLIQPRIGACSPDGREAALFLGDPDPARIGLVIVNLSTGEQRPLLNKFNVTVIRNAPSNP